MDLIDLSEVALERLAEEGAEKDKNLGQDMQFHKIRILSIFNLTSASILLVAGSDMENLPLKVPILSMLYLGQLGNYALETWYVHSTRLIAHHHDIDVVVAYYATRLFWAPARLQTFWERMVGSMIKAAIKLILIAQLVLVLYGLGLSGHFSSSYR
ncbi:hypothetical protein C8R45DRAFT_1115065 [Mycena sanguinolenta]|nr:hypothetical protein C8R45DRAFT_1115065 [Mycena sanguinolenta]